MRGWEIAVSPGGFPCEATWGKEGTVCGLDVPAGYVLARHPDYPNEWMCLACMVATVKQYHNARMVAP